MPTCGLELGRAPRLVVGGSEFRVYLDDALEPYLARPASPERHRKLPKELVEVDPDGARRWRTIRANLEDSVDLQMRRLERILQTQYRWSRADWRARVHRHPLMALLAQRLIWGLYSKYGKLHGSFRVDEELELRGPDDELFEWPDAEFEVGAAHPFDMRVELIDAWSSLLADYEVVTLVPQFDRARRSPAVGQHRAEGVDYNLEFDTDWLLNWLYSHGWVRERQTWGWGACEKIYRTADVKARLHLTENEDKMSLRSVSFHRFLSYPQHSLQQRDVPPVVFSETLNEIDRMLDEYQAQADAS